MIRKQKNYVIFKLLSNYFVSFLPKFFRFYMIPRLSFIKSYKFIIITVHIGASTHLKNTPLFGQRLNIPAERCTLNKDHYVIVQCNFRDIENMEEPYWLFYLDFHLAVTIPKVFQMFEFLGVKFISSPTYNRNVDMYIQPAIHMFWERPQK